MAVCTDCWQVQIEEFPPVDLMFTNHPYVTGINKPVVDHFETLASDAIDKAQLSENALVLDIGANDGTLLSTFSRHGMRTLGIDPGKRTGKLAKDNGCIVCEAFWTQTTAKALKTLGIMPDLITATAVFYHMEDIHSFISGLSELMGENTVFLTQCVYLKDVIEKFQFDHFYHEHTMIHALGPLKKLFSAYGLKMIDVDFYPIHGGSFALYVAREDSNYPTSEKIDTAIAEERAAGLQDLRTYQNFSERVRENGEALVNLLSEIKEEGKTVYALGAPLKGSTLLNHYNIGPDLVECATELNKFKIGRFTPGTHIPIVYEESVESPPDYYLVLSWNFIDYFVDKFDHYLKSGGKFILPHPDVKVIDQTGERTCS